MINSFLANSNQLLGCLGECGGFIKAQLERETWWWALCATGSDWRMAGLRLNQHWGNNTGLRAEKYQTIFKTQIRTWWNSKVPHCIYIQLGRKRWHPTPILLPGKSHGRRSLVGWSQWGREESDTTERLPFHFSLSCMGEGNGNSLQCSCLENPRDGGAWLTAVYGVIQSRTRRKWLSSSSSDLLFLNFCGLWMCSASTNA